MEAFHSQPAAPEGPPPSVERPGSVPEVFLSYSHEDSKWVHEYLLKRLREEGVKVIIDSDDFEIGDYSLLAMEKAVARCRHTILVLTPAWVASAWARFESILATTSGPLDRRVLPLRLKKCTPSSGLAALVYADFTQRARWNTEFAKLLRAIAATAAPSETVQGEPVRCGLAALADLMQEPEVRAAVIAFRIHFQRVCDRVGVVDGYKKLHDQLHTLQLHCYDQIVQETKRFPGDDSAASNLRAHATTLRSTIAELQRIERRANLPAGELSWVQRSLEPALESLHAALETGEPRSLERTRTLLNRVLTIRPSEINTRLGDTARDLPLSELIRAMTVVRDRMGSLELDLEKVRQFEAGIEALDRLSQTLAAQVADHDRWQEAEQELRLIEETWDGTIEGMKDSWSRIRETVEPMTSAGAELWAAPLRQEAQRLSEAIETLAPERAEECFRSFRREASTRFHQVDLMLMDQCDELHKVAEPLDSLLKRMEA